MIHVMNRRKFLEGSAIGAASLLVGCSSGPSEPTIAEPVTQTAQGAVRGALNEEVYAFKGMRYGASTAGPRRFLPPAPVEAWEGEFDATNYGQEAPQPHPHTEIDEVRATIPEHEVGEDCLRLNVWTRGLADDARRPVMVWLHGGGFSSGNGGYDIYDGHNLAKTRDVVAVSVNHRLNTFGFLNLTDIDPGADASNVGMQDIVAALEWVRDNVSNFGGDPQNVTIYGQSGGGGKVSTLLAMPSAEGLFHKAIVMSGSELRGIPLDVATKGAQESHDQAERQIASGPAGAADGADHGGVERHSWPVRSGGGRRDLEARPFYARRAPDVGQHSVADRQHGDRTHLLPQHAHRSHR